MALALGIIALGIFAYFVFGLNGKAKTATTTPEKHVVANEKLQIKDEKVGTGAAVKTGDTVVIHYNGTLTDGTKFDSSYDRKKPFETQIGVGAVIKGWDEGVVGMKVGGKRKLTIPPSLGYGDQANGAIPANATLVFDVELIEVK